MTLKVVIIHSYFEKTLDLYKIDGYTTISRSTHVLSHFLPFCSKRFFLNEQGGNNIMHQRIKTTSLDKNISTIRKERNDITSGNTLILRRIN